ncbi:flagellar protein FliT [Paraclostridium sordellii]|uniref:flagellar protein FliT n=1 Tax=Paraclostridium sordellii TaxID=1505 RepID=UPI00038543CC|nr:flagellar protein FliT [Paeniclostridium sordellii]EPZ62744.1 flagellar FliT family protein [[Clostridium] sordellii VPI 9048] [Paeniclostridium sordellii VPI 9048]CEK39043.1 flagellar FliT family protein [[Clostridium] sordellii] [Paeniclostridium sordellii]
MEEYVNEYKQISLYTMERLEQDENYDINELLDKRQEILDKINDKNLFKQMLVEDGILGIDEKIHFLLKEKMIKVKMEIKEHKKSIQANSSYVNFSKEKLNILNKKV